MKPLLDDYLSDDAEIQKMESEPTRTKIEKRKQRWRKFIAGDPSVKYMFLLHPPDGLPERPLPYPENVAVRIEWAWQRYQVLTEQVKWLGDDAIPFLDPYTGTEVFAEAFGCPVYFGDAHKSLHLC